MKTKNDVRNTLVKIIRSVLPDDFNFPFDKANLHLTHDLGMDSLALVSLVVICEQELGVKLSEAPKFVTSVSTLDEAVDYLVDNDLLSKNTAEETRSY